MNSNTFTPTGEKAGWMQPRYLREIKKERLFWRGDVNYIESRAGFITKNFIEQLDQTKDWIIDTRVHMLMPGWYPCIGGWHLDDIPRDTDNGQPNYKNPSYISEHVIAIVDALDAPTGSLTEFLTSDVTLPDVPDDKILYGEWSKEINKQLKEGTITSAHAAERALVSFNNQTFHRGQPASSSGWRFFIRATTNTQLEVENEIRKQVNVYIQAEAGW